MWYRKAAEQGMASAQYFLGGCYRDGKGVGTNIVEAVTWFRKAQNDSALLKADGRFASLPIAASRTVNLGGTVATVGFSQHRFAGVFAQVGQGRDHVAVRRRR